MHKTQSKTSIFLASCMLSIILLSLISSIIIYRQISHLQASSTDTQLVDFINEYEHELMRTKIAFIDSFKAESTADHRRDFDQWFNTLANRTSSLDFVGKEFSELYEKLNVPLFKTNIYRIKNLSTDLKLDNIQNIYLIKDLFDELIFEVHNFQIKWGYHSEEIVSTDHQDTLKSYQNTVLLIFVSLIVGVIMALYLLSNNKKLLNLQRTLEQRVYVRTKELKDTNSELILEVQEHKRTEILLKQSQQFAEKAHQKIMLQANYDQLTKLPNRRLFLERLTQATKRADRNESLVALLFLDLDRFKYVNDTLGHSIGDELLVEAAVRLQKVLRVSDTAARFGGDEFAIVLSDIEELETVELIVN